MALGHTPQDAVELLKGIDTTLATNERIKRALKARG
ncbi:MAG TPA: hypothetical protein PKD20_01405 [Candidatus Saccharibacteria bacterium]|nr:hypothetical protein [Candidatus Saccharibacteria bacterium]